MPDAGIHAKPLSEKLGVKPGMRIAVIALNDPEFIRSLQSTAEIALAKPARETDIIFLATESRKHLTRIAKLIPNLAQNGALWVVYPKAVSVVTESNVREAGLAAGLVDNKVVSFSPTHTALRFVIPLAQRGPHPDQQLASFIARYSPEVAACANQALKKLRKLIPGAVELVYDNYNALAIGFAPGERASEAVVSIAVFPRWVSLFFLQAQLGPGLPDPAGLLRGSGTRSRHTVLKTAAMLDDSHIRTLITHALEQASTAIDPARPRRIVVKAIVAKQRPRITPQ